jgi:hypothetical protein
MPVSGADKLATQISLEAIKSGTLPGREIVVAGYTAKRRLKAVADMQQFAVLCGVSCN